MASMICASSTLSTQSSLVKRLRITNSMHPPYSRLNPNSSINVSCVQHVSCKNKFISVESSTKSSFYKGDAFSSFSLIPKISRASTTKSSSFTAITAIHEENQAKRKIWGFKVTQNGEDVSLKDKYEEKVLLIVNIPEQGSEHTDWEYELLHELYANYKNRGPGLEILGFKYDKKETGGKQRIKGGPKKILTAKFPLFDKVQLNRKPYWPNLSWWRENELWHHLKTNTPGGGEDITEEFEKFLIAPDGIPVGRFKRFPKFDKNAGPMEGGRPTSGVSSLSSPDVIRDQIDRLMREYK